MTLDNMTLKCHVYSRHQGRLPMGQDNRDERCYGIKELAELGGVTRRTVRYYVQRGLLPTPLGTGRGPHYTAAHLERLIHIRTLQETGVPLAEIAARPSSRREEPGCASYSPTGWNCTCAPVRRASSRRNWRVSLRPHGKPLDS